MRIEFQQTLEDYREAYESHGIAAERPTESGKIQATIWQFSGALITGILTVIYSPWKPGSSLADWLIPFLVVPTLPWISLFGYVLWFQLRSAPQMPASLPPWKRTGGNALSKPIRKGAISKTFHGGMMNLLIAAVLMSFALFQHATEPDEPANLVAFALGCSMAFLPWGLYLLYAAALKSGSADRQIEASWNRQTQLHEKNVFELDQIQVMQATPYSRTEFKWIAFGGLVETPNLFLLYRTTVTFYIIPKRAFESQNMIDAFRNMVSNLAGKQASAFPVLPMPVVDAGLQPHTAPDQIQLEAKP